MVNMCSTMGIFSAVVNSSPAAVAQGANKGTGDAEWSAAVAAATNNGTYGVSLNGTGGATGGFLPTGADARDIKRF
jgi:hypothetical protein